MRDLSELWGRWDEYFAALNAPAEEPGESESEGEDEGAFEVLETGLPLGELPSTPKRVARKATEAGFTVEGYEARVQVRDTFYKTGDRKGELKKAAFEQRNIFIGGYVPKSLLRFHAAWLGSKFSAHIWDPVGRFRYANSQQADERETYWMDTSSRSFERWIQDWGEMLQAAALAKKEAA